MERNLYCFGLAAFEQFLTCRPHLSNSSAEMGISVPRNKLLWDVHGKSRKSLSLPITIWQSLSLGTCFCWNRQAVNPASGLFVYVSFLFLRLLKGTELSALVRLVCITDGLSTSDLHLFILTFFFFFKEESYPNTSEMGRFMKAKKSKVEKEVYVFCRDLLLCKCTERISWLFGRLYNS